MGTCRSLGRDLWHRLRYIGNDGGSLYPFRSIPSSGFVPLRMPSTSKFCYPFSSASSRVFSFMVLLIALLPLVLHVALIQVS